MIINVKHSHVKYNNVAFYKCIFILKKNTLCIIQHSDTKISLNVIIIYFQNIFKRTKRPNRA